MSGVNLSGRIVVGGVAGAGGGVNIVCSGPGPHIPASGILGQADKAITGMLCPSSACQAAPLAAGAAANTNSVNQAALLAKAANALAANANYQAIATPTQAQAVAQVAALTAQVNALIRLAANQLSSTSGT